MPAFIDVGQLVVGADSHATLCVVMVMRRLCLQLRNRGRRMGQHGQWQVSDIDASVCIEAGVRGYACLPSLMLHETRGWCRLTCDVVCRDGYAPIMPAAAQPWEADMATWPVASKWYCCKRLH